MLFSFCSGRPAHRRDERTRRPSPGMIYSRAQHAGLITRKNGRGESQAAAVVGYSVDARTARERGLAYIRSTSATANAIAPVAMAVALAMSAKPWNGPWRRTSRNTEFHVKSGVPQPRTPIALRWFQQHEIDGTSALIPDRQLGDGSGLFCGVFPAARQARGPRELSLDHQLGRARQIATIKLKS
jgi:hypothetical protein